MKPGSLVRFFRFGTSHIGLVMESGIGGWGDLVRVLWDGKVILMAEDGLREVINESEGR